MPLPTQKQISFARNVIAGMKPVEALLQSSYNTDNMKPASISTLASQLLGNPQIAHAVRMAQQETLRGGRLTREDLIADLENVVATNVSDFIDFRVIIVEDIDGRLHRQAIWAFKDTDDMKPEQLACISEIRETQNGRFTLKLESKTAARQQLTKLHGWDAAPKAAVGQDGQDVAPVVVQITRTVVDA